MKRSYLAVFALLVAITLALGLVLAQQQANEQAVEDVARQWEERYNAGDAEGVAELYTEGAVVYGADGSVYEGRDAIQDDILGLLDAGFTEVSIELIETEAVNDTAYYIGRFMFTHDEAGTTLEGYFMKILQREDGEWSIHRQIANMVLSEDWVEEEMEEMDEEEENGTGG